LWRGCVDYWGKGYEAFWERGGAGKYLNRWMHGRCLSRWMRRNYSEEEEVSGGNIVLFLRRGPGEVWHPVKYHRSKGDPYGSICELLKLKRSRSVLTRLTLLAGSKKMGTISSLI
jgi:hypothetical protein